MAHRSFRNCNVAFKCLINDILNPDNSRFTARKPSRVGDVVRYKMPQIITYENPRERVLFNEARDCNPFFHLMESLWMLAGRDDVEKMAFYNSKISEIASDDGKTFHGAYGKRWRHWFGYDQLEAISEELKKDSNSRRMVLEMWDACCENPTAEAIGARHDLYMATHGGKDVPCNTHAYFEIEDGALQMTVCNRSNDLVLGMLGANVVHFSFLQEYMAARIGVPVGLYHQFTNNLHVYTDTVKDDWLTDLTPDYYTERVRMLSVPLVVESPELFEEELAPFVEDYVGKTDVPAGLWSKVSFFRSVAYPAALAFIGYKNKDFKYALYYANKIISDDWRLECTRWLNRRKAAHENRNAEQIGVDKNPYAVNELKRQETGSEMA